MTLPADVRRGVEARLGPIRLLASVGGGCIHPAFRIATASGDLFLKYGHGTAPGFFAVEAEGLRQLKEAAPSLRVPAVEGHFDGDAGEEFGWIALEWLEPGRRGPDFARRLAAGLAEVHSPRSGGWGWERDGYIGTLPQRNQLASDWPGFWWSRRLEPQLEQARAGGAVPGGDDAWARLQHSLPALLAPADAEGPSLLHGDLWGGNILATASGEPAIVDPAVYRGHREVDLAMSELFGGFPPEFYSAYDALRPLEPGYREIRRGIYQLYFLLVHVNLFGEGYVARTAATLRAVLVSL